jgi:hypothetical protein
LKPLLAICVGTQPVREIRRTAAIGMNREEVIIRDHLVKVMGANLMDDAIERQRVPHNSRSFGKSPQTVCSIQPAQQTKWRDSTNILEFCAAEASDARSVTCARSGIRINS